VYDKGISMSHDPEDRERLLTGYRNGDMLAPHLDTSEALRLMAHDYACAITERRRPVSDGYSGYRVVRLLELAQRSMAQNGRPIEVPANGVADQTIRANGTASHNGTETLQVATA
jgi:hypothetical protein